MADVVPLRQSISLEPWGGYLPSDIIQRPPPRQWLVDAMIPRRELVLLAGAPKSAKSQLIEQLAISAALGVPWIGRHVEQARALCLFLEDDRDELDNRLCNICEAYQVQPFHLDDRLEFNPRPGLSTKLITFPRANTKLVHDGTLDPEQPLWTPWGEQVWAEVKERGYQLLIIDTATRALGWPAKWSGDKASNVAVALRRKAVELDISIVVTDHTNRADAGSFAGTNTWWGSIRAAMNLRIPVDDMTREPERGKRVLRDLGGNYGSFDPIRLEWRNDILEPEVVEPIEKRPKTYQERTEFGYELLGYLGKCVAAGKLVPIDELDRQSLPNRVRKWRKLPLNDLYAAQQWMLDNHLVEVVRVGNKAAIRPRNLKYSGERSWP